MGITRRQLQRAIGSVIMASVLIVDYHFLVRRGLRQTLTEEFQDIICGEAPNAQDGLKAFGRRTWDLVIVAVPIRGNGGFRLLAELRRLQPECKVLILSSRSERNQAEHALHRGAFGYLSIDASRSEVVRALKAIFQGKRHFPSAARGQTREFLKPGENGYEILSPREYDVMIAITNGKSTNEIAASLKVSAKTVCTYKRRTLNKLCVNTTAELVRYVIDHGLT
jgi:two-component system, NarL family, invasion response regulator UvrY